jgi:hypothetical protein
MDLGSDDGTLETLRVIAEANQKVKLVHGHWPEIDAAAFATLANQLVAECKHDNVLYYQADEIWHEDLLKLTREKLDQGKFDLTFWRIQFRENFQAIKWFPHPVHRVGRKGSFNFIDDGMRAWNRSRFRLMR